MSASGSTRHDRHSSRDGSQDYENEFLSKLQRQLRRRDEEVQMLEAEIAELRSAKAKALDKAQAAQDKMKMYEQKYMNLKEDYKRSEEARKAQADENSRLKQLNANMKSLIERTPAPRRNVQHTGIPFPASAAGPPSSTSSDHRREIISHSFSSGSHAAPRSSFEVPPPRPTFVGQGPESRTLPSFASRPVPRPVTVRPPSEATQPPSESGIEKMSKLKIKLENAPFLAAFDEVFLDVEKFAKKWTLPVSPPTGGSAFAPPAALDSVWNDFGNISAISHMWSAKKLRHMLVVRTILHDFAVNKWKLTYLYSFPLGETIVRKLKEVQKVMQNASSSSDSPRRSAAIADQARIVTKFEKGYPNLDKWIEKVSNDSANKMFDTLRPALRKDPQCLKDMIPLYVKAHRLALTLWSQPSDWKMDFVKGGARSYFNPSIHAHRNEELQSLDSSQVNAMDLKVLFCLAPVITQLTYPGESIVSSCIRLAEVVLSRDGITAN